MCVRERERVGAGVFCVGVGVGVGARLRLYVSVCVSLCVCVCVYKASLSRISSGVCDGATGLEERLGGERLGEMRRGNTRTSEHSSDRQHAPLITFNREHTLNTFQLPSTKSLSFSCFSLIALTKSYTKNECRWTTL